MRQFKKFYPLLALFAVAVLVCVVIRSAKSYKENNISFLSMVWYEIKFLFSFAAFAPKFE